jgi:hypothetical protein
VLSMVPRVAPSVIVGETAETGAIIAGLDHVDCGHEISHRFGLGHRVKRFRSLWASS